METSIYTPGAGHRPPVLAGRDTLMQSWRLMLNDVAVRGRVVARDIVLAGPRGIGKTAALLAFGDICRSSHYEVVNLQAAAGNASLVESLLSEAREQIDVDAGTWQRAKRAFERIGGVDIPVAGFGAGMSTRDHRQAPPPVSPGSLARALADLADEVRRDHPSAGVLITIDEMQVAPAADLALLAAALQRLNADYPQAIVLFAGSGLPHMPEVLRGAGVTHPDRLFDIRQLPLTLSCEDARFAIVEPARTHDVRWEPAAADLIVQATNGYPAHLQLFADHAWRLADASAHTITLADAESALSAAGAELEEHTLGNWCQTHLCADSQTSGACLNAVIHSFTEFRVFESLAKNTSLLGPWLERLTDRQAELLTAIALHGGTATTADLTATLQRSSSTTYSRTRDELITAGDIYALRRGELALTVPLSGPYLAAHYEELRGRASVPVLALDEMRSVAEAIAIGSFGPRRTTLILPSASSGNPDMATAREEQRNEKCR
ncbi:MAG TPA: AAA family ATPase [Steroidobacteraceae bacterium]|nr:AAA family ATPase [Steroidobacteraceae bacterium]